MKSACSLVDDASLGLRLPLSGSGCPRLPVSWGMGQSIASQLCSVLCSVTRPGSVSVQGFSPGSCPTVWFAISSQFCQIALGAFRPGPYSKQCSPHLPAQPLLPSGGCRRLGCFSAGSYHWARNLQVLIIYLLFLPVMLPSEVPRFATDTPVRLFPGVWKLLSFLKLPSQDGSLSLPLVSLFYIFSYFLSKTMGCFFGCLMSSAGIQKLFCGIYSAFKCSFVEFVGRNWSPCPIPLPSQDCPPAFNYFKGLSKLKNM